MRALPLHALSCYIAAAISGAGGLRPRLWHPFRAVASLSADRSLSRNLYAVGQPLSTGVLQSQAPMTHTQPPMADTRPPMAGMRSIGRSTVRGMARLPSFCTAGLALAVHGDTPASSIRITTG